MTYAVTILETYEEDHRLFDKCTEKLKPLEANNAFNKSTAPAPNQEQLKKLRANAFNTAKKLNEED